MFNPTQYSISKTNDWTAKYSPRSDFPDAHFSSAGQTTISVRDLVFDTYESKTDVRTVYTNKIMDLMKIETFGEEMRPPLVSFRWGPGHYFKSVVKSVTQELTLFTPTGTPVRARVSIELMGVGQVVGAKMGTNPTSYAKAFTVRVVHQGETLDLIAFEEYGDSRHWRRIAEFNRLRDPLRLRPGQRIAIPQID